MTGIVRHLDDQCIGCQYCIFKCPYDVPKYSPSKGIVRKCDMCHDRLAVGEAPACVQSCPNKAIRIKNVKVETVAAAGEANSFLPGAPDASYTLPTTTYRTERFLPGNLQPADSYSARPQHAHMPLVFMLVLTQMSVGAFVIQLLMTRQFDWAGSELVHVVAAILLGFIGMAAALFHLGRPFYAFRAFIGLRTSWLSREILAFSLFPIVTSVHAGALIFGGKLVVDSTGAFAAIVGAAAVFCSAMIYIDTQRPFWNAAFSFSKFFGTCVVLGIPVTMLIVLCDTQFSTTSTFNAVLQNELKMLAGWLLVASIAKLVCESAIFISLRSRAHTPLKRSAMLLQSELGLTSFQRYFFGVVGGVGIPALLYVQASVEHPFSAAFLAVIVILAVVMLLIGELLERYLYFAAVTPPKMPGVQAS